MPRDDGIATETFICQSTPHSNANSAYWSNLANQIAAGGIGRPDYMDYDVYFYDGLNWDNILGMTQPHYNPQLIGSMEAVLQWYAEFKGLTDWRQYLHVHDDQYVHTGLRKLLCKLGITMDLELIAGYSYHGFYGLDVYKTYVSTAMEDSIHDQQVAW